MSREQLTAAALALPPEEQLKLAQALWENVHGPEDTFVPDEAFLAEMHRRDVELASGTVRGYSREEVMAAARQAIPSHL